MDYSADPVRAEGPPAVTEGTPDGPIVLVLDPAGIGKHEGLPATWREPARHWQLIWCRLPSDGSLLEADEALADPPTPGQVVHVLASGPYADAALRLAESHPDSVRSVLLVDPGANGYVAPGLGDEADQRWEADHAARIEALARAGIEVRVIAHSMGGARDRIPAPLPLGHPDVVDAVRKAVAELEPERKE
jgi:pimeloyl-ACP methyl ester carboxylesterase